MTPRAAAKAVVTLAALDVRRRPDHRAEMTSQLLMGEVVRILARSADGAWWRIENEVDGYRGWIRNWGAVPAPGPSGAGWGRKATFRVIVPVAEVRAARAGSKLVSPAVFNNRLIAGGRIGRHRHVWLPDGRDGWIPSTCLAEDGGGPPDLRDRIDSLLGSPYLWGGRTPLGYDCSGFVQQVLAEQGIRVPRDAHHQYRACAPLGRGESPALGDLVFFGVRGRPVSHVGIGTGVEGGWFAHARGCVRISTLDPGESLCDKDLLPQFRGWRRLRPLVHGRARQQRAGQKSA